MKKNLIRLLALALAVCLVLALGACGGSKEDNSSHPVDSSSAEGNADSTPGSSAVGGGLTESGKFASIADFVNSDIMQSQLDSMKGQLGGDDSALDIKGEGNKLIYTFTYNLGDQDPEVISTALETAMEQMASTFEAIAASLKEAVEVDNPVVVVTYKTTDGTELFSKEYSGK